MNYRTTCPHCASVFRLGPDQLDAAQGWVQCSVCGAAFDARPGLRQADGSPLPEPDLPEPVDAEATLPETVDTPLAPDTTEAEAGLPADPAPATDTEAAVPVGIAQREDTPDLSSIILIDPDQPPADDDPGPMPQIPAQSALPPVYPPPRRPVPPAETPPPARPALAQVQYAQPQMRPAPRANAFIASQQTRTGLWVAASLALLLVLAAQTVYFLRDTLASQWPQTRPALAQLCATLGCTLSLPKNLAQLQIVGSDLQIEPNGNLILALTLGNRAAHAQAWPVLVLTLTDQRNRPLARRSFAPSEYLGDTARIAAGIPPRSEQPLNLPLAVQGLTPMGFGLQLVY